MSTRRHKASDESGRPSFNKLPNYGSSQVPIYYYVFDLPMLAGRDVMSSPLEERRHSLQTEVLSKLADPIRFSPTLESTLDDLIRSVREQRFEGLIAKRRNDRYEPGQRSGAWLKMRVNKGQEFVIGGYTSGAKNFDALSSAITKAANCSMSDAPATDSRRRCGYSYFGASGGWKSTPVRLRICRNR